MATPYYVYGNVENDAFKKRLPGSRERYTSVVQWGENDVKRYFSSIDTDVYFGDTRIDEMVAFDFIIEEKKLPLYGYNTYTPKRIMTGQKTIQGSFAINFTKTFNLKYILDEVAPSLYANDYEMVTSFCGDDNMAIFNKGFDITISYGDAKNDSDYKSYNACTQTLVGCYITSYRQAFDTSGEPILDMYTFIAKDLIIQDVFESNDSAEQKDTHHTATTSKEPNPDDYSFGNLSNAEESESAMIAFDNFDNSNGQYDDNKKYATVAVLVNPTLDYIDGQYRLSMLVTMYDRDDIAVDSVRLEIDNTEINLHMNFNLNKTLGHNSYYCNLVGNTSVYGSKIKELLNTEPIECKVHIEAHAPDKEYKISGESTQLNKGTGL